ncbi:hypothetical protein [Gordoniibacillus kamchatkensis]|uniref:hypothetical protein n=1 Tax=Gordoniibacillus kamchatkensis TaxID=1590651 RepID=UPI000AA4019A|nr:hypothetical protein [Paenibacillus sp. VKM B-2647]
MSEHNRQSYAAHWPGADAVPLQAAVWRLRVRGCWNEAASLLAEAARHNPAAALECAALLTEKCLFTHDGWQDAEEAMTHAEAMAGDDKAAVGAAASERAFLAYAAALAGGQDRKAEAFAALDKAGNCLDEHSPGWAQHEFRRGLLFENLTGDLVAAQAAYERAHAAAEANGDAMLLSYTSRHLGSIAQRSGELNKAHHYYSESLRLREETAFAIGIAPALAALASVSAEPEASRLRAEAPGSYGLSTACRYGSPD